VAQPLPLRPQLVLAARLEPGGVAGEPGERLQPVVCCSRAAGQLLVGAPRGLEVAPGAAGGARVEPGVRVEEVALVAGPREPALLELAAHRDQRLGDGGHVLAGRAAAPGVGAGAAVGEDAPRQDDALFPAGPEL